MFRYDDLSPGIAGRKVRTGKGAPLRKAQVEVTLRKP